MATSSLEAENSRLKELIAQQQRQLDALTQARPLREVRSRGSCRASPYPAPAAPLATARAPVAPPDLAAKASSAHNASGCHDVRSTQQDVVPLNKILNLALKYGLCTSSQMAMMQDYVRSGRFQAGYYVNMWSGRLASHSPEAAEALRGLEAAVPAAQAKAAAEVPSGGALTQEVGKPRQGSEECDDAEAAADEWSDAPAELMRRATRNFQQPREDTAISSNTDHVALFNKDAPDVKRPFVLPRALFDRLRPYQRDGVAWMAKLYKNGQGGILADDMGLGKTVQACALLNSIRRNGATHALALVPVTLLDQWAAEAETWCPDMPVCVYYGSAAERTRALRKVMQPRGGLLLTSYSVLKRDDNSRLLQVTISDVDGEPSEEQEGSKVAEHKPWDVVLCDEAHTMRNISTLLGRRLRTVRAGCRLLLTGTPVQNALQDLWALMDFAQPGLLGNHTTFVKQFSDPIDKGSVRGASPFAVGLKKHLCEQLWQLMEPHMLRRTKESVGLVEGACATTVSKSLAQASNENQRSLLPKLETVVWLRPTKEQASAYRKLLDQSGVIQEATSATKLGLEVFRAIGLLKRLCNHPVLGLPVSHPGVWQDILAEASGKPMGKRKADRLAKAIQLTSPEAAVSTAGKLAAAAPGGEEAESVRMGQAVESLLQKLPRDSEALLSQSAKLRCVSKLVPSLAKRGHRILIFSQGVKMMDLIETCVLARQKIPFLRIDGQTDMSTRADRVKTFQTQRDKYQCMLLTTSVGGYGLNLTSADRVIILDPAWNPATDMQAVDRTFRIGQTREVRVYRLVMSGFIEDKMFRLQVFKMGLTKTALDGRQQQRYFTSSEIRGLFQWTDPDEGETRKLLIEKHGAEQDRAIEQHAQEDGAHEGWLAAGPAVGLSNFSTLYSTLAQDEDDVPDEGCASEIAEMKAQLGSADERIQLTLGKRQRVEEEYAASKKAMEDASSGATAAMAKKSEAARLVKQKHAALTEAKRQEAAAAKRLDKASRVQLAAREQKLSAERARAQQEQAAAAAAAATAEAHSSMSAAEEALQRAFAGVDEALAQAGEEATAPVVAGAGPLRAARRACERMRKSVETALDGRKALEAAAEGVLKADLAMREVEEGPTAKALSKAREKERSKAITAQMKAQDRFDMARESASQASAALHEAGMAFADSLQGDISGQARAAQQSAKAAFRQLAAAWKTARTLEESWAKVLALHSKAVQRASAAITADLEAQANEISANQEFQEAAAEDEQARVTRTTLETQIAEAAAERAEAEVQEVTSKRMRTEHKMAIDSAKAALKSAKAAERDAMAGRTAVVGHYAGRRAGAGDAIGAEKKDTEMVEDSAAVAAEALSAVRALKEEEYDANQVEDAYQAKKKQRCEPA